MGFDYYIVNHNNHTIYELGSYKSFHFIQELFRHNVNDDKANLLYKDKFIEFCLGQYKEELEDFNEPFNNESCNYILYIANQIFEFVDGDDPEKGFELAADCTELISELLNKGYLIIASRYFSSSKDINEHIRFLNSLGQYRGIKRAPPPDIDYSIPITKIKLFLPFI
jgi:hypothetical protein